MVSLIEDEIGNGYTIRSDLMKDGDTLQCRDDSDMHIKKEGEGVVLIKKSFRKNCFHTKK